MICKNCGSIIDDGKRVCSCCGAQVQEAAVLTQEQPTAQPNMSYNAFYKVAVSKKSNSWPKVMMIICYITAALGVVSFFLFGPLAILDIVVYLVSAIMLTKSKTLPWVLIPTVYGGVFTVIGLLNGGSLGGIAALIIGIKSIQILNKVKKAYEQYQSTGIIPEPQI